jgi:DNA polymerase-3 subunit chi
MTRIDFYILSDGQAQAREVYACRIADKAYQLGHNIYIHSESPQQAERLDDLLWSLKAGSFIPHALYRDDPQLPVTIGHDAEPLENTDLLINLSAEAPSFFSRFERVAEIVNEDPQYKAQARERFRFYRDRGYELQHHQIRQ